VDSDQILAEALVAWNQAQQDAAIDKVRPLADQNDPAGLLLISWFMHQMGEPRLKEGFPYAKKAAEQGNPWVLSFYFGHLVEDVATRSEAIDLIALNPMGGVNSNDPIGRAMGFAVEGDVKSTGDMLRAAAGPHPWPVPPDPAEIRQRVTQLDKAVSTVNEQQTTAVSAIRTSADEVEAEREHFEVRGKALTRLLDNLSNASTQSHFDSQARKYGRESRLIWSMGVAVLVLAACAAFLPLVLNYVADHELKGQSNIAAHLGATLALAAVAGVLLARARSRDRESQRNGDLSVALLTVFTYSDQIANDEEKERFKHEMARLVVETFLKHKPMEEESRSLLKDISYPGAPKPAPSPE
jgi:hypothetical protein